MRPATHHLSSAIDLALAQAECEAMRVTRCAVVAAVEAEAERLRQLEAKNDEALWCALESLSESPELEDRKCAVDAARHLASASAGACVAVDGLLALLRSLDVRMPEGS